jgi:hypothetical protein
MMNREYGSNTRAAARLIAALVSLALLLLLVAPPASVAETCGVCTGEGEHITIAIDPGFVVVEPGDSFTVKVRVDTRGRVVDGAGAYLDFNPKILQVVTLWPGNTLPFVWTAPSEFIDNEQGRVNYSASIMLDGSPVSGSFDLLTIQFVAQRKSIGSALSFSRAPVARETRASDICGCPLPFKVEEATVVVSELSRVTLPLLLRIG